MRNGHRRHIIGHEHAVSGNLTSQARVNRQGNTIHLIMLHEVTNRSISRPV